MKGFLDYIPGDSLFHRLDPRTKLLTAFLLCAACFAADSLAILPCLLALETALGFAAHIGRFTVRLLLKLCRLSLFLVVIQLLVIRSGVPVFPGIPLITDTGLITAAFAALRLIGATLPLAIMLSVTRCSDLAGALVSRWHVPYPYAFAVTSAIRFIPTFSSAMEDIIEAQTARGVAFDTGNPLKKFGMIVPLCVPLLVSSVRNIDDSAVAARLRGFSLRTKDSGWKTYRMQPADWLILTGSLCITTAVILL